MGWDMIMMEWDIIQSSSHQYIIPLRNLLVSVGFIYLGADMGGMECFSVDISRELKIYNGI